MPLKKFYAIICMNFDTIIHSKKAVYSKCQGPYMKYLKALIVDDEVDTCFLLSSILNQKKITASFVHSIAGAKAILKNETPDVIFLDNHLKDGRGIDFIPSIAHEFPAIKIIFITAYDTRTDMNIAYEKGAHYFIGKPFSRSTITEALNTLFEG